MLCHVLAYMCFNFVKNISSMHTNEKLFKAVESGDAAKVEKVLAEERINPALYYGAKSIILASEKGYVEILQMLLENGEKIHRETFWLNTYKPAYFSLTRAVSKGHTEIVKILLDHGAGILKDDLTIAFADALFAGNLELMLVLLNAKIRINVNFQDSKTGFTPLMYACYVAQEKQEILVEALLAAGADVDMERVYWETEGESRVKKVCTALTYAKEQGNTKIIEMLENSKKHRKKRGTTIKTGV
jgi:ankyrin repeat protein